MNWKLENEIIDWKWLSSIEACQVNDFKRLLKPYFESNTNLIANCNNICLYYYVLQCNGNLTLRFTNIFYSKMFERYYLNNEVRGR